MITVTSKTNGYDENTYADASGMGNGDVKVFKLQAGSSCSILSDYNCEQLFKLHNETFYKLPAGFEITRGAYDTGYDDY